MSTSNNVFVSFSFENENINFVNNLINLIKKENYINDWSEKEDRSHCSDNKIWEYLLSKIKKCSITVVALTEDLLTYNRYKISHKLNSFLKSGWVYNEISASLRDWSGNRINGIIVVIPDYLENQIRLLDANNQLPKIIQLNRKNKFYNNTIYFDPYSNYIDIYTFAEFANNTKMIIDNCLIKRQNQINNQEYKITYEFHKR